MSDLSYLALGDSYTIGESVPVRESWPHQLTAALHCRGHLFAPPTVIAQTGWSCAELAEQVRLASQSEQISGRYDLVSLSVGVNDQYRGWSVDEFERAFAALLDDAGAIASQPHRVFVLSIPDWGLTPFARQDQRDPNQIATEIDRFNARKSAICDERGIAFLDVTRLSRQHPELLAHDQLHPAGAQYAGWVSHILEAVLTLLRHDRPCAQPRSG